MKRRNTTAIIALAAALCLASCDGNGSRQKAEALLEEAGQLFSDGDYDRALAKIDSLRKVFPNAIETRKKALTLYQSISLKQAQEDLAHTDSILQELTHDYNYQKAKVDKDREMLRATAEELQMLNETKVRLDSLKVRFDMQCAKIKYIHKKQKEDIK
ncbi:MAG: hypothetical protein PUB65_07060 [Prevotellaceae bacterium]|nr:hypothetical protein [Prevotellaceae bacterium]